MAMINEKKSEDRGQEQDLKSLSSISPLYDDENEKRLHINAIEMIALRIGSPVEDVKRLYEIVLRRFKKAVKIKDFLPILVSKKVEHLLSIRERKQGIG